MAATDVLTGVILHSTVADAQALRIQVGRCVLYVHMCVSPCLYVSCMGLIVLEADPR